MTNEYTIKTFGIDLVNLDLLVNTENKEKRKKIANEVEKNETLPHPKG